MNRRGYARPAAPDPARWPSLLLATLLTAGVIIAPAAMARTTQSTQGGSYSIEQYSIDGGSGQSNGGSYVISGSVGQPDADPLGPASGGSYSLTGGIWPGTPAPAALPDPVFANGFE